MSIQAPFPVDPKLTAVAVGYRNQAYIADHVIPRATVPSRLFKWWEYPIDESFNVTDTKVGRTGAPNEIEFRAEDREGSVDDYGLDDPVPQEDINTGATMGYDPRTHATERLTDYIALGREVRAAKLLFNPATYPAGNKIQLATAADRWDDPASNPVDDILEGLEVCLVRPNIAVLGQKVWSKLRRHPKIAKAVNANSGDEAVATRQAVADLLELDEVVVGQSRLNTARKGQAANLARVWGNHASFIYRNRNFSFRSPDLTFAATAQWGDKIAGSMPDSKIGLRGGERVRMGESVRELVIAGYAGYLIQDAVN
ncbi:phage capsid protein [Mycobacterium sp. KBS0706]|uniref:major capsid protein n=1 Tax=Mycobacterium sp. KBS0706 TaxID=2578109 RepID=UPI00110F9875|nr:major capsid protein [Mycobacterium sp. KBS0706]TSD86017.1 phage capsid protein [Mycobacterium sp. KBS0706]